MLLFSVGSAAAKDGQSCIDANNRGNELRPRGELLAAKREFLQCAAPACPKIIREECTELVARVERSIPTLVIAATEPDGKDISAFSVAVNAVPLPAMRAGQAVPVDPGSHRIRIVSQDGRSAETTIVAREGEKNRTVRLKLPPAQTQRVHSEPVPVVRAPQRESSRPRAAGPHAAVWVLGGVGVAALGSFAYFAIDSQAQLDDMEKRCAPACADDEVDDLYRKSLIADISLGVGVVALGAAGYLWLKTSESGQAPALRLTPGHGGATLGTRFAF